MDITAIASLVALLGFLGFLIERITEHFVSPFVETLNLSDKQHKLVLMSVSLVLGLVTAFAFGLDVITPLVTPFVAQPPVPLMGIVLTGMILGGGSQFIHDLWPTNATATVKVTAPATSGQTTSATASVDTTPVPK